VAEEVSQHRSQQAEAQVVAERRARGEPPFLTVAIPHYRHRRYLEVVLASVFEQRFDDFEIVVSDDCSPDDSCSVIPPLLSASDHPFRYYLQRSNLGYDGNVRFCLGAAQGRYVLLLGNDDALAGPTALEDVAAGLQRLDMPEVAFTNFEDWASGDVVRRAHATQVLGQGPAAAIQFFRSFSFVSGDIFDRAAARRHETDRWDRSIYYQIYLAARIVAAGGRMGALDCSAVRKDVQIDGQTVPNYCTRWAGAPWSFVPRHTGLDSVIRVAAHGVLPLLPEPERSAALRKIAAQVLTITYPFWLFEYRRVANWSFAAGVARGLWPGKLLAEYRLSHRDQARLWGLYAAVTLAGLGIPSGLFNRFRSRLADTVRWLRQSRFAAGQH
jgi:glycosyltransferase involved in cell wall biosynthesis